MASILTLTHIRGKNAIIKLMETEISLIDDLILELKLQVKLVWHSYMYLSWQ